MNPLPDPSRRLAIYFRPLPEADRWIPGDRWWRPVVRRIVRGPRRCGGLDRVAANLALGLRQIGQPFHLNLPFARLRPGDRAVFLGIGRRCLDGYRRSEPVVAGIGLMTHPREFPELCRRYPVARFLQASAWSSNLYRPYFGDRCAVWPVGIDTDRWRPPPGPARKPIDFVIYDKIRWNRPEREADLLAPILGQLARRGLSHRIIRYGRYEPAEYAAALAGARALVFLTEHESQGLACQEAMAAGVPILAWDSGLCLDPEQANDDGSPPPATSVPYFDERCGMTFAGAAEFGAALPEFVARLREGAWAPRDYILEHLTLAAAARNFVALVKEALP